MSNKKAPPSSKTTRYLVLWWTSKVPYAAIFEDLVSAEAAACVRNAVVATITGEDANVERVDDWYRRDEGGRPMAAEWRLTIEEVGRSRFAALASTSRAAEAASEPASEASDA